VSLALAAGATTTLKLGTGICLVPQRDPIQTAKQVASLDLYCGGRFLFGVGGGWNRPEIAHHGTDPDVRFAVMRERIEAMKQLWTQEKAEYHGKYVDFGPSYAWPKPAQRPHPPIHVGGAGKRAIRRAVRYGNGWIPLMGQGDDDPVALVPHVREVLAEAGRERDPFEITIYFCPPDAEVVARCREGGIDRVLFPCPSAPAAGVEAALDAYAAHLAGG
jgi:probable F420-dependent oxidoreductase